MTIGILALSPEFDSETLEYTASTSNATNTITATATDESATVEINVDETSVENGEAATWASGENIVTIKVTNGASETVYTVIVTKE